MATTKIPAQYRHICDVCGKEERTEHESRPTYWGDLIVSADAYDYQGCAVADATVRRRLCDNCLGEASAMFNRWAEEKRRKGDGR